MKIFSGTTRADIMFQVERYLGLSAESLARLTVAQALTRLKKLADEGRHEALGLARRVASACKKAGADARALLFPSQKGGGPLGRVAVWRVLSSAKRALGVRAKDVLRHLQRLARAGTPAPPQENPILAALAVIASKRRGTTTAPEEWDWGDEAPPVLLT